MAPRLAAVRWRSWILIRHHHPPMLPVGEFPVWQQVHGLLVIHQPILPMRDLLHAVLRGVGVTIGQFADGSAREHAIVAVMICKKRVHLMGSVAPVGAGVQAIDDLLSCVLARGTGLVRTGSQGVLVRHCGA